MEDTKAKIKAGYKAPELPVMSDASLRRKGFTLAEKILRKNAGVEEVKPGDIVVTHPDFLMIHDIYTPYLLDTLHEMGTKEIDDPDKVCIVFDHCMPTAVAKMTRLITMLVLSLPKNMASRNSTLGKVSATP